MLALHPALSRVALIIQTIRRDWSGSVWTDEASNVCRLDPSGAVQGGCDGALSRRATSVDTALDGHDGLHRATEWDYDTIVLDVMAGRASDGQPWVVMSGQVPVALSWSTARSSWTATPGVP